MTVPMVEESDVCLRKKRGGAEPGQRKPDGFLSPSIFGARCISQQSYNAARSYEIYKPFSEAMKPQFER